MSPVVGIFTRRTEAERTSEQLHALGILQDHISLLSPCAPEAEMELAPMMDTERPLMGQLFGGLVGSVLGAGVGMLAAVAISRFLSGVVPVLVLGGVATVLASLAGTLSGIEIGRVVEQALTTGGPKDEMFVYEDALRKGRSVLIVLADDHTQAQQVHRLLQQAGAESVDAARAQWWLGCAVRNRPCMRSRAGIL
jgi:hypothetical protein